jgi:hypothetical protein
VPLAVSEAALGLLVLNEASFHARPMSSPIAVGSDELDEALHVTSVANAVPQSIVSTVNSIKRKVFIIILFVVYNMLMCKNFNRAQRYT